MKAIDILNYFYSVADWIDPINTVDKIIIGDPQKEIRSILVTWISSLEAIKVAVQSGFDMIITHEPTFYVHRNELDVVDFNDISRLKRDYINSHDLVILRCHDVWDGMPDIGIPWALAKFLDLGDKPTVTEKNGMLQRYDIEPIILDEFAHRIAVKTYEIGEPKIQVIGDGKQTISKVGIGTGCCCDPFLMEKMGCDVSIVCDDGTLFWSEIQRAIDENYPLIRLNHKTTEEPGMVTLFEYIKKNFPKINCEQFINVSRYRVLGER